MEEYYYIMPDNKRGGPVLPERFAEKGITADTLVWRQGLEDWTPAGKIEELKDYVLPSANSAKSQYEQSLSSEPNRPKAMNYNGYMMPKPDNNMLWAVLSTICCCTPLGIVAIVKASQVNTLYYSGQYEQAVLKADSARRWAIWALVATVVLNFFNGLVNLLFFNTSDAMQLTSIYGL